jgi:hypothetical protein
MNEEYIKREADKASAHVVSEPFSDFKRGFKEGFPAGYIKGYEDRKNEKRISDEELAAKFDKVIRQPNLIVASVDDLVKIAKDYAG